jgi:multidrug efflux pump subunit AcrA (membrane-fusion protein)
MRRGITRRLEAVPTGVLVALVVVLSGCHGEPAVAPPEPRAAAAPRSVTAARPSDLALLEAPAHVVAAPGSEAQVAASHQARILAVHVRAGDRVEAGAPIVDVVMPEVLEAAARLVSVVPVRSLRAQRRTELAALEGEGLVDRARVFEQETELASLDATRASALATLRAASLTAAEAQTALRRGVITLRAPIAGLVREVNAVEGEVRAAGVQPLAVIVAPVPARVEARFAQRVPHGGTLTFVGIDGTRTPLAPEPIAESLDPEDGTRLVWLSPATETRLTGGLHGRVVVMLATPDVVELDAHALVVTPEGTFVDRLDASGAPSRIPVEVLTASATRAIVRGPLASGDRVSIEPTREVAAEEE